jgi:hypothetical protein
VVELPNERGVTTDVARQMFSISPKGQIHNDKDMGALIKQVNNNKESGKKTLKYPYAHDQPVWHCNV